MTKLQSFKKLKGHSSWYKKSLLFSCLEASVTKALGTALINWKVDEFILILRQNGLQ